ncbi:hypothetical protein [Pseudomonas sp. CM27]|uniref:hypothetical protein n=1 Tax=Pseudomonas sp. CM27 TaxID=2738452 RepID=UPI00155548FA|nr:hypothetical protein [Pseudomonas sp. CM27]NQD72925.1 hypothetical protein [Pseudomonas sp. CM27]
MARKQETPASTADAKDSVSTVDSSSGPTEAAGLPLSPSRVIVPDASESADSGVPATAPGTVEDSGLLTAEGQAAAGTGLDCVTGEQGAGISTTDAADAASEAVAQAASVLADSGAGADDLALDDRANSNPASLQIYPLRSYMDEGELRRRGGPAYKVPRRHAEELVQRNLASLEPLKE